MSTATLNVSEYDVIADVVQHYIDGAKSGNFLAYGPPA